ncbi:MAG: amidohydrolase family protein [Planctomycetota bacterium]
MPATPPPVPEQTPGRPVLGAYHSFEHADDHDSANLLELDYTSLAKALPYRGPVVDIHTHVTSPKAAELYLEVAERFNVVKTFTMTGLPHARRLAPLVGEKIEFMCVPDFLAKDTPGTFTTQWLDDIRAFVEELGCRVVKLWAAPRVVDLAEDVPDASFSVEEAKLGSQLRRRGVELAYDLGVRTFMTHVADPDTWFATAYADASRYGTKRQQYEPLEKLLDDFSDCTWIGAHMGGSPEDLDFLQGLLDRHSNYVVDTSACKWQIRELSRHPEQFAAFCRRNAGRVLFGTDIVASEQMNQIGDDLFASRWWTLRTLIETDYDGPSPIVDPDFHQVDPSIPLRSSAHLRGAAVDPTLWPGLYHDTAAALFADLGGL